ncbi:MAG: transcription termination factor Rho [Lachnospiraceae bacterium]|nr:transcription termination factor Rho [Lachnospiraceae bacterium]
MREKLETLTVDQLREMAKEKGLKVSSKTKGEIIDLLIEAYESEPKQSSDNAGEICEGIFEIVELESEHSKRTVGFIRCENFLPGVDDVYVSNQQIYRFDLRTGDILKGIKKHQREGEKYAALTTLLEINGVDAEKVKNRVRFEKLTPVFPDKKLKLLDSSDKSTVAMRVIDLLSPIGKGQRGLIVSPPKAGKTTLLKQVAKSILKYNNDLHLLILLVDERPEEVTDMKDEVKGDNVEIIYSTFDELPERHKRVAEMVVERAKRLVEQKQDVVILLDSLTRLTRAYNLTCTASGRTLSGGLDPASLHMPKKFFGAARNMKEGGSLTILATALVDTGSRMDDVIYEEFKGTGNMELVLDRKLQERRIFPAIDIQKSGTRRDDLLLKPNELEVANYIHKLVNDQKKEDAIEMILDMFDRTGSNDEFIFQMQKKKASEE